MSKKHTLFLSVLFTLQIAEPTPPRTEHVAEFLDEALQAREGHSQHFHYHKIGTVWTCTSLWHSLLAYVGLMKDGSNPLDVSSYSFRDSAFEEKQKTDPDYDKMFQRKPQNLQQAYNWFRSSMAILRFKHKTEHLRNFSINATDNTPSFTYQENPNYPIPGMKDGDKITHPFGTPTERAKTLHDEALKQLEGELQNLPDGEQKEFDIPGHGIFKCGRYNLSYNTSYSCDRD